MASSARSKPADPGVRGPVPARGGRGRAGRSGRVATPVVDPAIARVDRAVERCLDEARVAPGATVCVALSGGCDSTVLLDTLARLAPERGLSLRAVHVHHGLSPNASRWAARARALCARAGVRCVVARVSVPPGGGGKGIEAAAREARYRALDRQRADWIALGHHQDDQAETVLLQLLRGAGARGLSAMPFVSEGRRWLRPLLDLPRRAIEDCARARALEWVEDESNASEDQDRNFLRHGVLPLLRARFPGTGGALARSARLLAEADALARDVGRADLAQARAPDGSLAIEALREPGGARARALLRAWFEQAGEPMPSERRLGEALRQALGAAADASVAVRLHTHVLRAWRGRLWLLAGGETRSPSESTPQAWNRRARMRLPGGVLVSRVASGEGVCLDWLRDHPIDVACRADANGPVPRIVIGTPPRRRTLRNLWQEGAVPPWHRARWPLLWHAGRLVGVPGLAVACEARARPGERGRVFEWWPD